MPYVSNSKVVFQVQRISGADLAAHEIHEFRRKGDMTHCDPTRLHLNRVVMGVQDPMFPDQFLAPKAAVKAHLLATGATHDKRNVKPYTRLVLSASPGYFRPEQPEAVGTWDDARLNSWVRRNLAWLRKTFGADAVHVSLHLDEATPHLHALIVPTYIKTTKRQSRRVISHGSHRFFKAAPHERDENGKIISRAMLSYERGRRDYAAAMKKLSLEYGTEVPEEFKQMTIAGKREYLHVELLKTVEKIAALDAAATEVSIERAASTVVQTVNAKGFERNLAERQRLVAERDALRKRERILAAKERGVQALEDEELVYRPAQEEKPEGLGWGPNAPAAKADRISLAEIIRPAKNWILNRAKKMASFAKRAIDAAEKRARELIAAREVEFARREAELARRARVLVALERAAGRAAPARVRAVANYRGPEHYTEADFPSAFFVPVGKVDSEKIRKELDGFKNRHLQMRWQATREAILLIENNPDLKQACARGVKVLEFEAGARGYDLENDRVDLSKAREPERAKAHYETWKPTVVGKRRGPAQNQRVRG